MRKGIVVAIDGPAGAGKSSVAKAVAALSGLTYVDTGAMYRVVGVFAAEQGIAFTDEVALTSLAQTLTIEFLPGPEQQHVVGNGRDVTEEIRKPDAGKAASDVSKILGVREALGRVQRSMVDSGGVVMEGRDIGTVIAPHAEVKVFMTASPETRARRRVRDLEAAGHPTSVDQVLEGIKARDAQDQGRTHAPLKPAPDAHVLDTSEMAFDEVVQTIRSWIESARS